MKTALTDHGLVICDPNGEPRIILDATQSESVFVELRDRLDRQLLLSMEKDATIIKLNRSEMRQGASISVTEAGGAITLYDKTQTPTVSVVIDLHENSIRVLTSKNGKIQTDVLM